MTQTKYYTLAVSVHGGPMELDDQDFPSPEAAYARLQEIRDLFERKAITDWEIKEHTYTSPPDPTEEVWCE